MGAGPHWFIARYAQTTPTGNWATSDQPFLNLRRAQVIFAPASP
jgi:hypothetical protein